MTKSHTDADFDKAMQEQGVPEVGFGNIKQEQGEPVAITITGKLGNIYSFTGDYSLKKGDKVYTTPQQRKPLTVQQLTDLFHADGADPFEFARAIEAAHGIKE
jgi:hypothetical protein